MWFSKIHFQLSDLIIALQKFIYEKNVIKYGIVMLGQDLINNHNIKLLKNISKDKMKQKSKDNMISVSEGNIK